MRWELASERNAVHGPIDRRMGNLCHRRRAFPKAAYQVGAEAEFRTTRRVFRLALFSR